jgi:hypothetical protein
LDEGACAELANALDPSAVEQAFRRARPKAVIDQLTALPKDPADLPGYLANDVKLRIEGGGNLHRPAMACGVKRYLQQSSGFFLKAGDGLADGSVPMADDAGVNVARSARMYTDLEAPALTPGEDDDPLPIRQWLPRSAEWLKAPPVP